MISSRFICPAFRLPRQCRPVAAACHPKYLEASNSGPLRLSSAGESPRIRSRPESPIREEQGRERRRAVDDVLKRLRDGPSNSAMRWRTKPASPKTACKRNTKLVSQRLDQILLRQKNRQLDRLYGQIALHSREARSRR